MQQPERKPRPRTRFKLGPRFVLTPIKISLAINLIILLITLGAQFFIQPVVPLFFSLPSGANHLVSKGWLLLLPLLSALINLFHLGGIKLFALHQLMIKLYIWAGLILQVILLLITVRNILVVLT